MYRIRAIIVASLFALVLAACGGGGITVGSGNVISETREVSDISAVALSTSGALTITQGETESLTIEADDNILPLLTSDVVNGTLKLDSKPNTSFSTQNSIIYTLTVKDISAITGTGSGSIEVGDLTPQSDLSMTITGSGSLNASAIHSEANISITAEGSGGFNVKGIEGDAVSLTIRGNGGGEILLMMATTVDVTLTGSGSLSTNGAAQSQTVNLSGSGAYHASNFATPDGVVSVGGSGSAEVLIIGTLDATVTGSGSIYYAGDPTVEQHDNGSGEIKKQS